MLLTALKFTFISVNFYFLSKIRTHSIGKIQSFLFMRCGQSSYKHLSFKINEIIWIKMHIACYLQFQKEIYLYINNSSITLFYAKNSEKDYTINIEI